MTLTDLQLQLRAMENQLAALQAEIERMKPKPASEKETLYKELTRLAQKNPLENRQFPPEARAEKKAYLACLSCLMQEERDGFADRLLYLTRIAQGMELSLSAEEIYGLGLNLDAAALNSACEELRPRRYALLTDALILANLTGEADKESFAFVADLAAVLDCDKDDLFGISQVAKAVLRNDLDQLKTIRLPAPNRWAGQFEQHIPESWLQANRVLCKELCLKPREVGEKLLDTAKRLTYSVEKDCKAGMQVRPGETIAVYKETVERISIFGSEYSHIDSVNDISITAPCDGIVALKSHGDPDGTFSIYVVSYFDPWAIPDQNEGPKNTDDPETAPQAEPEDAHSSTSFFKNLHAMLQ